MIGEWLGPLKPGAVGYVVQDGYSEPEFLACIGALTRAGVAENDLADAAEVCEKLLRNRTPEDAGELVAAVMHTTGCDSFSAALAVRAVAGRAAK